MTPTITLFSERRDLSSHSASLAGSIVIHCVVIAVLWFGIAYAPQLNADVVTEHYEVRHLELHTQKQIEAAAKSIAHYPGPTHESGPKAKSAPPKSGAQLTAHARLGPQTLIQPDLPDTVTLKEAVPVPTLVLWQANKTPAKDIIAEQQDTRAAADVTPSLDRPNDQTNLADVDLSSLNLTAVNIPVFAGTTSPVVVHGPEIAQAAPATISQTAAQPSPAAVLSISDLKMTDGSVMLPPVNESARNDAPGNPALDEIQEVSASGKDAGVNTDNSGSSSGAKETAASPPNSIRPQGQLNAADATPPAPSIEKAKSENNQRSATAIALPRDGRFGSVVVGDSVQDEFPEMANMWSGRMAYTVYLHVGLKRSWILEYWLPRADDAEAAGNVNHLDAPWPYNIVRPNIDSGAIAADALMVRGFVNRSGRFETLSIAFPENFPEAQFVLSALEQWQFRPAMQNGRSTAVEVLLIIPEELD